MKKFTYTQNNSGGDYIFPKWTGPAHMGGVFAAYDWQDKQVDVWVMADSAAQADQRVQAWSDVYFDGCDDGLDCDCCGDRWYRADD